MLGCGYGAAGWVLCMAMATMPIVAQRQKPFEVEDQGREMYHSKGQQASEWLSAGDGAGRFLHITDMHPDQYYAPGSRINDACHSQPDNVDEEMQRKRKKEKKGKKGKRKPKRAGYWGAPVSVCDAPQYLIESTLDWLAESWVTPPGQNGEPGSGFDFILWTGDTARHDIDFTHPRNAQEIFEYNRWALHLFESKFPNTPIVPNIGNNDIIPHNIMFPGPNSLTKAYKDLWAAHIPKEQHESFLDGGYFVKEVIANDLGVLSLNTLFWYDANAATRGCKKSSEPGSIQLDWMEEQLSELRNRSMQAHLIGHVPPTAGNFFSACYERYTDIVLRYQDTIVGQHFGHMNVDAMFLQEDFTIASQSGTDPAQGSRDDDQVRVQTLAGDLRKDYDLVPTKQKTNLDAYLPFFVAPSVVPTFLPTVRVWTYNNSRPLDRVAKRFAQHSRGHKTNQTVDLTSYLDDSILSVALALTGQDAAASPLSRSHRRPRHRKKHRKGHSLPRHASSDSPSRKNSYRTMLGYSQWVLDLDGHNRRYEKQHRKNDGGGLDDDDADKVHYHLEYTTYDEETLWRDYLGQTATAGHVHRPVPKALLDRELSLRKSRAPSMMSGAWRWLTDRSAPLTSRVNVPRRVRHLTDYRLPSMTVEHVLEWSRELAANDKLWTRFRARIYTESGAEE